MEDRDRFHIARGEVEIAVSIEIRCRHLGWYPRTDREVLRFREGSISIPDDQRGVVGAAVERQDIHESIAVEVCDLGSGRIVADGYADALGEGSGARVQPEGDVVVARIGVEEVKPPVFIEISCGDKPGGSVYLETYGLGKNSAAVIPEELDGEEVRCDQVEITVFVEIGGFDGAGPDTGGDVCPGEDALALVVEQRES